MGGGGGVSGAVIFPDYIQDMHGQILASISVNADGSWDGSPPALGGWDLVSSIQEIEDPAHVFLNAYPYAAINAASTMPTSPAAPLADTDLFLDFFSSQVSAFVTTGVGDYITSSLLHVTNVTTTLPDIPKDFTFGVSTTDVTQANTHFKSHSASIRSELDDYVTLLNNSVGSNLDGLMISASSSAVHGLAMTAFTTLWEQVVDQANVKLSDCSIPKKVNQLAILTKAAKDADANVKSAVRLAKYIVDNNLIGEVVTQFAARREITYQAQASQFAGTMADLNAVNSTGFLWGMALLRAEQSREVAEFDANLSYQAFQQALSSYIQLRGTDLELGIRAELADTAAHNALLEASIRLLSTLKTREEITPTQMLALWNPIFQAEVGYLGQATAAAYGDTGALQQLGGQLGIDIEKVNKLAKEQRYMQGLQQVQQFYLNKPIVSKELANLRTEQNRMRITAQREYDTLIYDLAQERLLWDFKVWREVSDILAAPAGMSASVPKKPSAAASALGGALQGAGAGAALGPVGMGVGAGLGLLGGLLGSQ